MRSCICLLYISLAGLIPLAQAESPDALYANRTDLASARRAAELWTAGLRADPRDFDAAWKLARADYWLGGHTPASEQQAFYEKGIDAGKKAIAIEPNRPEGHFWTAANMGALAESFGVRAGLKYRKPIKEELEFVLKTDPAFEQGSADRALGRWYDKVPGLFGGDEKLAEQHLRASLMYNPLSTASHYFLAELMLDHGRKGEARDELQKVLAVPPEPEWDPENADFKVKARQMLQKLGGGR